MSRTETRTVTIAHNDDDTWTFIHSNGKRTSYGYGTPLCEQLGVTRPRKPREFHGVPEEQVRDIARWGHYANDLPMFKIATLAAREKVAEWDAKDECLIRPGDIVTIPSGSTVYTVVSVKKDEGIVELSWDQTKSTWWPADHLILVERPDEGSPTNPKLKETTQGEFT